MNHLYPPLVIATLLISSFPLKAANNLPVPAIEPGAGEIPIDYYRDEATGDVWGTTPAWQLPSPTNGKMPQEMWKFGLRSIYLTKYACWEPAVRDWMPTNIANGILYCTNPQDRQKTIQYLRTLADILEAQLKNEGTALEGNTSEPKEFQGILAAHNKWRQQVNVPALSWSSSAASIAQAWANNLQSRGCVMEHNPNRGNYGENIYWSFGFSPTPANVVDSWGEEIKDYDYATNTCQAGKVCGHYTQVVWRDTQEVGCGKASCNDEQVWVCNYSPPGNWVGQKPY